MEGGQSGTYLRLTSVSSGLRVSVAKTYRDENETKMNISAQTQRPSSATGRSGFDAVVVNRCPFMRLERERRVSPMQKALQFSALQLLSTLSPTRSLSRNAGLLVSYTNYLTPPQTTSAVSLKLHTNLSSNHDTTPVSISVNPPTFHPRLGGTQKFRFSFLYSTAEEGLCVWAEIFIFVSFSSLYVLVMLTRGPDNALVSLR